MAHPRKYKSSTNGTGDCIQSTCCLHLHDSFPVRHAVTMCKQCKVDDVDTHMDLQGVAEHYLLQDRRESRSVSIWPDIAI